MHKGVMKRLFSFLMAAVMVAALLPADLRVKAAANDTAISAADSNDTVAAEDHVHDGITFTAWNDPTSLPTAPGHYCLTVNVTLNGKWYAAPGVTDLCLNGHSIIGQIELAGDEPGQAVLDLHDCKETGTLTVSGGTLLNISSNAAFNMYGGSISGCNHSGECIRVMFDTSVFNMYAGSITNNSGSYIVNGAGHFNMYGGSISDNTGIGVNVANFSISGSPVIRNNKVTSGDTETEKNVFFMALSKIEIAGVLTDGADVGVTINKTLSCAEPFVLTSGLSGKGDESAFAGDQGYSVRVNSDGEAELYAEHSWSEWTETTQPKCTKEGVETRECSVCHETETRTVAASGHTEEVMTAVPATCTETGLTEGKRCSVCGEILVAQTTISALGHHWTNWIVTTQPTCITKGVETRYCDRCTATDTRETDYGMHRPTYISAIPATCTEPGKTSGQKCSVCGTIIEEPKDIPALGHSGVWEQTLAPTCLEKGIESRTCIRCGVTEERDIEALGHKYVVRGYDWIETENGYNATAEAICLWDMNHRILETVEAELSIQLEPTCLDPGYGIYTAVFTNDLFSAKTKDAYLGPLGHNVVSHERKNPTCTESGWEAYCTCTRCDYSTYEEIPSIGHDWDYEHAVFNWNGQECQTATVKCTNDNNHEMTIDVAVTASSGTGNDVGYLIYTASFTVGGETYTDIKKVEGHYHDSITFMPWSDPTSLPTAPGHYCLTVNVTLNGKWYAAPGVTDLCLNGHSITGQIELAGDEPGQAVLNLHDCKETGTLTVSGGTLLNISSNAAFNMYGGSISGCNHSGECIRVMFDTSVFNMYAGSITNNSGSYIVNGAGHFNMYGGSISDNTGIGVNVANFSISGSPVIRNNKVTSGDTETEKNVWFMALSKIEIAGELTDGADVGVTINKTLSCAQPFVLTSGLSGKGDESAFAGDQGYSVRVNSDGEAELYVEHSWSEPNWFWAEDYSSAAATFTCSVCGDEQTVTDSAPVETQVSAAGCESDKVVKYTAKVTFEGEEYNTESGNVTLQNTATGHTYGAPEWQWAPDYSSATATFRCTNEDDEQTVTDDSPETIVVSEETCTADKVVKYEAEVTFEGETFTDTTDDVTLDETALGHDWSDWAQTTAPGCETDGEETRTCSHCSETETRPVEALGHIWKAPEWSWDGHASATATFVCERDTDGSHTKILNAEISSEQGTDEDLGKTVYTATVAGPDGETYTDVLKETNTYTVTWKNWDGEVLETDENVPYGTEPTYDGETPDKDPDENGHYHFTGWSPEAAAVTADTEYTAVFGEAQAHSYGEPEWNWTETDDGWTASAVFACSECGYELTVPAAKPSYQVTKEPTVDEAGEGTYTATVTGPDGQNYTDTKVVVIAKLAASHIIVTDMTGGAATTTVDENALYLGENTFTATCAYDNDGEIVDAGCVIAIDNGNGTYTKLAVSTTDGVHNFTVNVTNADVHLVIVLKGDVNMDGAIDSVDMLKIKRAFLELPGSELTALQALAADVNGDEEADGLDMLKIKKFYLYGTGLLRIAHAASSETFSKYGEAPNQRRTGVTEDNPGGNMDGELNVMENPYNWTVVYRPVDKNRAEFIATFIIAAVANGSHIGYSQRGRAGVFDSLQAMNSTDPGAITDLVNCDCASLVGAAVYYSGLQWSTLRQLCTWEMADVLGGSGEFIVLTDNELTHHGTGIRRGDILFRSGHTAVSIDTDNVIPW